MGFGLFGKLPQKRDFISLGISGDVLSPLETWLQSAVAASRNELGRGWEELYLVAPIWRFWIGDDMLRGKLRRRADAVGRRHRAVLSRCLRSTPARRARACRRLPMRRRKNGSPRSRRGCSASWRMGRRPRWMRCLPACLLLPLTGWRRTRAARPSREGRCGRRVRIRTRRVCLASIFEDDYRQVARGRSYWWVPGQRTSAVRCMHARNGLPDPYFHHAYASGCGRLTVTVGVAARRLEPRSRQAALPDRSLIGWMLSRLTTPRFTALSQMSDSERTILRFESSAVAQGLRSRPQRGPLPDRAVAAACGSSPTAWVATMPARSPASIVEHLGTIGIASSAPDLRARFEDRLSRANRQIRAIAQPRRRDDRLDGRGPAHLRSQFACIWSGDSRVYRVARRRDHAIVARPHRSAGTARPRRHHAGGGACLAAPQRHHARRRRRGPRS